MIGRLFERRFSFATMKRFFDPKAMVFFRVVGEDGKPAVESLWAHDVGSDRYRIDNCPFFAYGVSLHDIVLAPPDAKRRLPTFQRVLSKSGNRTIRVLLDPPVETGNASDKLLRALVAKGCGYEAADRSYVAVNVPARVDLLAVARYVSLQNVLWEHADPSDDELRTVDP
jgi:hypothetical protein